LSKPYQIENRRAMQRFEAALRENQEPVQLLLPSVEIALAMKQGVGTLIRQAGLQLMQLVMERDVEQMLGPRYQQSEGRRGWRWGKEKGWCRIDGQKVPLDRLRIRNVEGGDIPLGSYLSFQHDPQWHSRLWQDVMRGLSTRQYGPVVRRFADAYGIEKSG
jgi:putative transposase